MRLGNTKLQNENDELRNDLEESERSLKMEVDQIRNLEAKLVRVM